MQRRFQQIDVFSDSLLGNPVGVVLDAEGLAGEQMQRFAQWSNLSETAFLLPPRDASADYRVRIFTPSQELPFAGHPTLGACHAWASTAGSDAERVVQECAAGLIPVRRSGRNWAFAAPNLVRSGPVDDRDLDRITRALGIDAGEVVAAQWVDNGPGWVAVLLPTVEALLALRPGPLDGFFIGAAAVHPPGGPADLEVRAFFDVGGTTVEDPVTGSLNASLAPWLTAAGVVGYPYTVRQGTAIHRDGRVEVSQGSDGRAWVGGHTRTCIQGTVTLP